MKLLVGSKLCKVGGINPIYYSSQLMFIAEFGFIFIYIFFLNISLQLLEMVAKIPNL
jgi:hypothetical protein